MTDRPPLLHVSTSPHDDDKFHEECGVFGVWHVTDAAALTALGLGQEVDLSAVRRRYSQLVRRYHPDRNGGDRTHEKKLGEVIEAWQTLKSAPRRQNLLPTQLRSA